MSRAATRWQIQWARARGLRVYAETGPQYIALTADDLRGLNMDFEGAKYVCSPPPRDADSQVAIWQGLRDGTFDLFSSDHCPFRFDGPADTGKDNPRARTSFRWVPNGIPGVETRLPILFSEGVSRGRISLQRFGALTSTNPARLYGLYPRKGSIAVGADADLTLWDANLTRSIRQADLNHGCDYPPTRGWRSPAGLSAPFCADAPSRWTVPRPASLPAPTCPAGPARRSKERAHACRPGRCAMREWRSTALRRRSGVCLREPGPLGPRCGPAYSHPHGS